MQLAAHVAEEEIQCLRREVEMLRGRTQSEDATLLHRQPKVLRRVLRMSFLKPDVQPQCCAYGNHVSPRCQNVVGRPACWKFQTLFNGTVANNGADISNVKNVSRSVGQAQAASVAPSSVIVSQVPLPSASIAAALQEGRHLCCQGA